MSGLDNLSEYKIMWLLVFFDLPTDTKRIRKHMLTSEKY